MRRRRFAGYCFFIAENMRSRVDAENLRGTLLLMFSAVNLYILLPSLTTTTSWGLTVAFRGLLELPSIFLFSTFRIP
jgi:hypothetical protein